MSYNHLTALRSGQNLGLELCRRHASNPAGKLEEPGCLHNLPFTVPGFRFTIQPLFRLTAVATHCRVCGVRPSNRIRRHVPHSRAGLPVSMQECWDWDVL